MRKLEYVEVAIPQAVHRDGGGTEVPSDAEDSGHTSWLLQEGYLDFEKGVIVLTGRGRAAIASAAKE
ncbi:MAG TPA: hypothetical protein VGG39_20970 [Polyangiaceae bacterium]|jgi:hypothetical protein